MFRTPDDSNDFRANSLRGKAAPGYFYKRRLFIGLLRDVARLYRKVHFGNRFFFATQRAICIFFLSSQFVHLDKINRSEEDRLAALFATAIFCLFIRTNTPMTGSSHCLESGLICRDRPPKRTQGEKQPRRRRTMTPRVAHLRTRICPLCKHLTFHLCPYLDLCHLVHLCRPFFIHLQTSDFINYPFR